MKAYKGHPVRGAISGFFTGVFVAIDLMFLGVIHTDSILVSALPLIGLVLGLVLGLWAPFGRAPAAAIPAAPPDMSPFVTATPEPPAPPAGDPMAHIGDNAPESAPTTEEPPTESS